MALYSRNRGWVSRPRRPVDVGPNPYDSGSSRFAERNRSTATSLPGGTVRVDIGEPITPLPSEGLRPKAVKGVKNSHVPRTAAAPAGVDGDAATFPPPKAPRPTAPPRSRREPWGVNRDDA